MGQTRGFLDVLVYVAGQNGDISPHRVRSVGSFFGLDVCCGQNGDISSTVRSTFALR